MEIRNGLNETMKQIQASGWISVLVHFLLLHMQKFSYGEIYPPVFGEKWEKMGTVDTAHVIKLRRKMMKGKQFTERMFTATKKHR